MGQAAASPNVHYACTQHTFRPDQRYPVRWLEWDEDYPLAQGIWPDSHPLTLSTWQEARELGYHYCAVIEGQQIQAIAAVWRYSMTAWEVAAVHTRPEARRRGYASAVVSFVTAYILDAGRCATCTTAWDNLAMQRTAEGVGFQRIEKGQQP
jgi:RimJ/RimL family protein N-acetyltransferase